MPGLLTMHVPHTMPGLLTMYLWLWFNHCVTCMWYIWAINKINNLRTHSLNLLLACILTYLFNCVITYLPACLPKRLTYHTSIQYYFIIIILKSIGEYTMFLPVTLLHQVHAHARISVAVRSFSLKLCTTQTCIVTMIVSEAVAVVTACVKHYVTSANCFQTLSYFLKHLY